MTFLHDDSLLSISSHAFADEQKLVQHLLTHLTDSEAKHAAILMRASHFVAGIREHSATGIEAFLTTYGLDSREGVAMMCLAEALLRIPDRATADQLIHSTFDDKNWAHYLGSSDSFFVNASSWGLLLTGSLVQLGDEGEKPGRMLNRLVHRLGEPVVREALKAAMRFIGGQFVLGETIEEALAKAKAGEKKGYRYSYDMLGEGARTAEQAAHYQKAYLHAIDSIASKRSTGELMQAAGISVKLSALHPRYQLLKEQRVMKELLPALKVIVARAMQANISLSIDAEESARLDVELMVYTALLRAPEFADYEGIGFVLQAYQKRALPVIDYLAKLCRKRAGAFRCGWSKALTGTARSSSRRCRGCRPTRSSRARSIQTYRTLPAPKQYFPMIASTRNLPPITR